MVKYGSIIYSAQEEYLGLFQSYSGLNKVYVNIEKSLLDLETGVDIIILADITRRDELGFWAREAIERLCVKPKGFNPPALGQVALW